MQLVGFTQLVYLYLHRGMVEVVSRLAHNQESVVRIHLPQLKLTN